MRLIQVLTATSPLYGKVTPAPPTELDLTDSNIVIDGNSLSTDQGGSSGHNYGAQLIALAPLASNGSSMLNYGVGGQTTLNMIADAASQIDSKYNPSRARNILLAWEIRNHLVINQPTVTEAFNDFKSYCLARKAVGWEVFVGTMITSWVANYKGDTSDASYITFNNELDAISTMLRANYSDFADGLMDFAAHPLLHGAGVNENYGYVYDPNNRPSPSSNGCFFDGTHNTDYGKSIIAQIALNAIKGL